MFTCKFKFLCYLSVNICYCLSCSQTDGLCVWLQKPMCNKKKKLLELLLLHDFFSELIITTASRGTNQVAGLDPVQNISWYKGHFFWNMQSVSKTSQKLVLTAGKGLSDNIFSHQKLVSWKDIELLVWKWLVFLNFKFLIIFNGIFCPFWSFLILNWHFILNLCLFLLLKFWKLWKV